MAGSTPPAKRQSRRGPAQKSGAVPESKPAEPGKAQSLDQWLAEITSSPHVVTVFGRGWEFKQPTGGRAQRYYQLMRTVGQGPRAAVSSVMFDETPAPDVTVPDPESGVEGATKTVTSPPGSAAADEFLRLAEEQVPVGAATEFWSRFQTELFDLGEA